jgi:hypothetical protein
VHRSLGQQHQDGGPHVPAPSAAGAAATASAAAPPARSGAEPGPESGAEARPESGAEARPESGAEGGTEAQGPALVAGVVAQVREKLVPGVPPGTA